MRKFALLTLLLTGLPSPAQIPATQVPIPIIRANTRMILLSVIATDKAGPVTDLTANEFSVLENGKPQKLTAFAFEQPTLLDEKITKPLPPNVYTNRPTYLTPSGPLTVLLLDALNTQATDQTYFRRELLQYLANQVHPGQRLAVFVSNCICCRTSPRTPSCFAAQCRVSLRRRPWNSSRMMSLHLRRQEISR